MTPGSIFNALRGIGGEFEVQRTLGTFGTVIYTVVTPAFVATGIIKDVSLTEFALAYPGGLAACIGATAGAIALKDRNVAVAKATEAKTRTDEAAAHASAGTTPDAVADAATDTAAAAVDKAAEIKGKADA